MAEAAESVVIELEARLAKFNADVRAGRINFDQAMVGITQSAGKAEQAISQGLGKTEKPFMSAATRSRQLGIQIGQLGSSLGSGMNPMTVFAQQAQDFTYVLGGTGGAAGKLATFFSGPWGAALLAAGIVVGTLASKLHFTGDALQEATDKAEKQAAQTKLTDAANEIFANTLGGVESAMRKTKEALDSLNDSGKSQARIALEGALAETERLKSLRATAQASITAARAQIELNSAQAGLEHVRGTADPRLVAVDQARNRLTQAEADLGKINGDISTTETRVAQLQAKFIAERVSENADPVQRIHNQYDALVTAAASRAAKEGLVGDALTREVAKRTEILRLQEASAVTAAQAAKKVGTQVGVNQVSSFIMPVSGPITSGFGARTPPTRGASSYHPAIDIGAPLGTPVKAAAGGVVITAGRMGGLGNVVIVDHGGGTISEYGHLSATLATVGQRVSQGDIIGKVGSTGISTGPHLDYRVRVGGRYVDPRTGKFPTDELASGTKANQLQQQAQREADRAVQQQATVNREMAGLEQQLLGAQRTKLLSAQEQLTLSEQQVIQQRDARNAGYASAAAAHQISDKDAQLLTAKSNQLATAQTLKLYADEGVRVATLNAQLDEQRRQATVNELQSALQQAKTGDERRDVSLRLLDAETELERIALQRVIDATAAGTAEHELAVLKLAQLGDEKARKAAAINRDPNNMGPGQAYLQSITQTAGQIGESLDNVVVDGLKSANSELASFISGTESLGQLWHNVSTQVVADLARIAVQQLLIKPIANLLFGGQQGGTGGLFGSLLGGLGGILGGGGGGGINIGGGTSSFFASHPFGFAGGGRPPVGKASWVGERGPELFVPDTSGTIVPNSDALRGAGGSSRVEVHIISDDEKFGAFIGQITDPRIAQASVRASRAGSIMGNQRLLNKQIHTLG